MDYKTTLLRIVRGELPWEAAKEFVAVSKDGDAWHFDSPSKETISPSLSDFMKGYESLQDESRRQEWASFLLAATDIDLSELQGTEQGDSMLDKLWDEAFKKRS